MKLYKIFMEGMKTHFTSNTFFRKFCRLRDNYKQYGEIREATELFDDET